MLGMVLAQYEANDASLIHDTIAQEPNRQEALTFSRRNYWVKVTNKKRCDYYLRISKKYAWRS